MDKKKKTKSAFKAFHQSLPVVREAVKLLQIPFIVTKLLQKPDCTLSDFYGACIEMREKLKIATTKQKKTDLAQCLLTEFENRRHQMIDNESMLSAVFLDRRYALDLTDGETELAKIALCNLWQRFCDARKKETSPQQTDQVELVEQVEQEESDDEFEFNMSSYMSSKAGETNTSIQTDMSSTRNDDAPNHQPNITHSKDAFMILLGDFENQFKVIHHSIPILEFWKDKMESLPELYEIAQILNSIPPSQATVERSFSALAYIYGPLRCKLSHELLEEILRIKLNSETANKIFENEKKELKTNFVNGLDDI